MRKVTLAILFILPVLWFGVLPDAMIALAQDEQPQVLLLEIEGALTPSWGEYLERGLETAQNQGFDFIIFQINTPG
ncbi:MAG: hypothetical protein ACK2U1_11925, partial [Anaerolineales bacterium]